MARTNTSSSLVTLCWKCQIGWYTLFLLWWAVWIWSWASSIQMQSRCLLLFICVYSLFILCEEDWGLQILNCSVINSLTHFWNRRVANLKSERAFWICESVCFSNLLDKMYHPCFQHKLRTFKLEIQNPNYHSSTYTCYFVLFIRHISLRFIHIARLQLRGNRVGLDNLSENWVGLWRIISF